MHSAAAAHWFRYRTRLFSGGDGIQVWVNPALVDTETEFGVREADRVACEFVPHPWPPIFVN